MSFATELHGGLLRRQISPRDLAAQLERQSKGVCGNYALRSVLSRLPLDLRFDGVMDGENRKFLQFTELDKSSPSYGASFYLDAEDVLLSAIKKRRDEKRQQFSAALNSSTAQLVSAS